MAKKALRYNYIKLFILLSLSIGLTSSFAAKRPATAHKRTTKRDRVVHARQQLKKQNRILKDLSFKISIYENKLNMVNKRYLITIKRQRKVETKLETLKRRWKHRESKFYQDLEDAKNSLKKAVLSTLSDTRPEHILSKKIIIKRLKRRINDINYDIKVNRKLQRNLAAIVVRYREYISLEKDLSSVLNDLELEKKERANLYISAKKEKDQWQQNYDSAKADLYLKKNVFSKKDLIPSGDMASPLDEFTGLEYKEKGISFKFSKEMPVRAPKAGKISYAGNLSTYGQVVIIDHGHSKRSVLLGNFVSTVQKGKYITKSGVIGRTRPSRKGVGKLYFEVRKKDRVQKTILLMDRKFLTKNNKTR